jgi:hypothetical protein
MSMQSHSNRGKTVIMAIAVVIAAIILIAFIGKLSDNQNYDNDKLNGQYTGSLSIEDFELCSSGICNMTLTFDGKGYATCNLNFTVETLHLSGEYICTGTDVAITMQSQTAALVLLGILSALNTVISGESQLAISNVQYNGTFFISRM